MYRFKKDGISVLAVVDRRRRKNNGLYPVKIEVIYRRVQKYYPTGKDVTLKEWDGLWKSRRITKKCASIENSFHLSRTDTVLPSPALPQWQSYKHSAASSYIY